VKGIILDKSEQYFTFLGGIFKAIQNKQEEYNWLITDYECYPQSEKCSELFNGKDIWISGSELTKMIETEDFQWIWGVFSGFPKGVPKDNVMEFDIPKAEEHEDFWKVPVSIQHPLADIEIVAWDSSLTLFISKDDELIKLFCEEFPLAENLTEYNQTK